MMIEINSSTGGTQRLFSVKYLFGEAKIPSNFLELGDGERNQKNARFRKTSSDLHLKFSGK